MHVRVRVCMCVRVRDTDDPGKQIRHTLLFLSLSYLLLSLHTLTLYTVLDLVLFLRILHKEAVQDHDHELEHTDDDREPLPIAARCQPHRRDRSRAAACGDVV